VLISCFCKRESADHVKDGALDAWLVHRKVTCRPKSVYFVQIQTWRPRELVPLLLIGLDWIGLDWIGLDWIGLDHWIAYLGLIFTHVA